MRGLLFIYLFLQLTVLNLSAQDCNITLDVVVPERIAPLPEACRGVLQKKLNMIAGQSGAIVGGVTPFALTADVELLDKQVLSGNPSKIMNEIGVTITVIDTNDGKVFASTYLDIKAIGNSETKAYIDGINRINPQSPILVDFAKDSRSKIIAYYDNNYQSIIKKANSLASMKRYDEALSHIISTPECCVGFDSAIAAALPIYSKYIDQLGVYNLEQAKRIWAANQNTSGGAAAGVYLSEIDPDAACYNAAQTLYTEIKKVCGDECTFLMRVHDDNVNLESQRIEAMRAVGVAYGEGQKEITTNLIK